jgi:hypothetical protein
MQIAVTAAVACMRAATGHIGRSFDEEIVMRLPILVLLALPTASWAQSQEAQPPVIGPVESAPQLPTEIVPDDHAKPLASSSQTGRIVSKNEAYNLGRAAEGRLGVRLGNDMSYRVTGN